MNKSIIIKSEWSSKKRITKDDFLKIYWKKRQEKWNLIILLQKKKKKSSSLQITEIEKEKKFIVYTEW